MGALASNAALKQNLVPPDIPRLRYSAKLTPGNTSYSPINTRSASPTRFMCGRDNSASGLSPIRRWFEMVRIWSISKSVSCFRVPSLPTDTRSG